MASFGMRSLVAAPSTGLLGRKVQTAVGVAGARLVSSLFIRYLPKEVEIAELQTLADEFQRTNSAAIKNVRVRLPTKKNEATGAIVSTRGFGFLDYDSQLDVQVVLKNLSKAPTTLPSGRPTMMHLLSRDSMSIFLSPSDTDPFITKHADVEDKIRELLKPHGTVNKVYVGRATTAWPLGFAIAEFEEDRAAFTAQRAVHGQTIDGFEYVLAARANNNDRRPPGAGSKQQRERGTQQPNQRREQNRPQRQQPEQGTTEAQSSKIF